MFNFLKKKPFIERLSDGIQKELSKRLSKKELLDFVSISEKYGLDKNYLHFRNQEPDFALGCFAVTLTSFANKMGEIGNPQLAEKAINLALKINPHWLPAYMTLALIHHYKGDTKKALICCDKALKIYRKLKSTPKEKLTFHEEGILIGNTGEEIKNLKNQLKVINKKL